MTSVEERPGAPAALGSTVAFLFAAGDTGGDRLAAIRSAVAAAGGRMLDVTVDSAPAWFPGPSSALACGRALRQVQGDLRIGIHCGEPLAIEEGRFFGAAVWTAARISGHAAPGTILLSATAAALLPPDQRVGLVPAGSAHLRGLADPVALVEDGRTDPLPVGDGHGGTTRSVLAIDQVGSTAALAGLGDTVARGAHTAVMDVIREAIDEFGGIELEYGGDGVTVSFPSALAALDCARAVQQAVARHRHRFPDADVRLRAAVVSGETEPDAPRWLLVAAAALIRLAGADEVLASPVTASLAADRRDHRFTASPDRDAMVLEWRPLDPGRALPPGLREAEVFVGREQALDVLMAAWAEALRGRSRLVLVDGVAGMGKTALAARFARAVIEHRGVALYGRASAVEPRPLEALADAVTEVLATSSRADLRRLLGEHAAALRSLLPVVGDRLPDVPEADLPDAARTAIWAAALGALIGALGDETPVLLVLDDLHRASPALVAALRVIAEAVASRPVLILGLRRPEERVGSALDPALQDAANHGVVVSGCVLGELDPAQAEELAEALSDGDHADRAAIMRAFDGRPRTIVELARGPRATLEADEPGADPDADPYQGLASFDEAASARFFGREQLTAELVAHVGAGAVTAVVGASGSGKSSLVHAGLLPALARDALPGSSAWDVVRIVPSSAPVQALAAGIAERFGAEPAEVGRSLHRGTIRDALDRLRPPGRRMLLVVDQAEELFTSTGAADRDRFIGLLEDATGDDGPIAVLLVTRAEFYGAWAASPVMATRLERNHLLVRAMTDTELRRAVETPAVAAGLAVDPALVDAVVADVAGEPGALPLLSTAMAATWSRRRGRRLTLRGYAETGGVRRAVAQLADAAYGALPEEQRPVARALLLRLARSGGPDGGLDLRRRAPLEEVLDLGPDAAAVLHAFVDQRLVVADDRTVEVAHEALLREWPLLRGWLDDDREGRALQQALAVDARTWRLQDRDASLLYRGSRLLRASELAGSGAVLAAAEQEFLAASTLDAADELTRARRSVTRFRRLAVGLVVVLVVALVVAGIAVVQGLAAARNATAARAAAVTEEADQLDDSQQDLAGLLALAADRVDPTPAAGAAVLAAANRTPDLIGVVALGGADATTASISADGRAEAVVAPGGVVSDFDLRSRTRLGRLVVHGAGARSQIAVSALGRYLAVAVAGRLHLLDTRSGHVVTVRRGTPQAIAFLADGVLAVLGSSLDVSFVAPGTGEAVSLPSTPDPNDPVAMSADGRIEAWGAQPLSTADNPEFSDYGRSTTRVFDTRTRKQIGPSIPGLLAGMSADGRVMAILRDDDLVVMDVATQRVVRTAVIGATLSPDEVLAATPSATVAFDATDDLLAFQGADAGNPVHLVDVSTGGQRTVDVPVTHATVLPPAFEGSDRLVLWTKHGAAVVAPPPTTPATPDPDEQAIPRQEYNPIPRAFVAVTSTGDRVAAVVPSSTEGGPDRYRLAPTTDLGTGAVISPTTGLRFDDITGAFSPDGTRFAALEWSPSANGSAEIGVWDVSTGRLVAVRGPLVSIPPSEEALRVDRIAFIGDSELAAVTTTYRADTTGAAPAVLDVWRLGADSTPTLRAGIGTAQIAAFSADGRMLATTDEEELFLWSTSTGKAVASAEVPGADVSCYSDLEFSTDDRFLSTGSSCGSTDSVVRWTVGGSFPATRVTLPDEVSDHAWAVSPDGSTIADLGPDGIEFRPIAGGRATEVAQPVVSTDRILGFTRSGDGVVVWDGSTLDLVLRSGGTAQLGPAAEAPPTTVRADDPDVIATRTGVLTSVVTGSEVVVEPYLTSRSAAATRICAIAGRDLTAAEWAQYFPGVTPTRLCG